MIVSDNGTEFTSNAVLAAAGQACNKPEKTFGEIIKLNLEFAKIPPLAWETWPVSSAADLAHRGAVDWYRTVPRSTCSYSVTVRTETMIGPR